jgi:dynein heavy chain
MEKENNLQIIKLSNPKFLQFIESGIRMGLPVLLENIEEQLDPSLEPVLQKNVFKQGGQKMIRLGDATIPYNDDFKFIITTKLANPHYLPEICIKVTVINFTVTPEGLEDQLLVDVVKYEQPELEQQKDQLVVQLAEFKRQLQELEDKILKLVSEATEDILDDEELIITLDQSKQTSLAIGERMIEAEKTAKMINENRENYRGVARRGSVLYFVISDLALIDPMYQYSLEYFSKLFNKRLEKSEQCEELEKRLEILTNDETSAFYINICRGLFEKDKLLYSFLNTASIFKRSGDITPEEWNCYLRGSSTDFSAFTNDVPYIPDPIFYKLKGLEEAHVNFIDISKSFASVDDANYWRPMMSSEEPHTLPYPPSFVDKLSPF